MSELLELIKKRHSIYGLSEKSTLADEALAGLLRQVIDNMPTAYNMQSSRMVLLLGGAHKTLWMDIVLGILQKKADPEKFPRTRLKIAGFAAGHGTVLYFDDTETTERMKAENPSYAEAFGEWVNVQGGMLQYAVWALLAEQGMGASLQHYNPIIDEAVKAQWKLPAHWRLMGQMPFGVATAPAGKKDKIDVNTRFKCFE